MLPIAAAAHESFCIPSSLHLRELSFFPAISRYHKMRTHALNQKLELLTFSSDHSKSGDKLGCPNDIPSTPNFSYPLSFLVSFQMPQEFRSMQSFRTSPHSERKIERSYANLIVRNSGKPRPFCKPKFTIAISTFVQIWTQPDRMESRPKLSKTSFPRRGRQRRCRRLRSTIRLFITKRRRLLSGVAKCAPKNG